MRLSKVLKHRLIAVVIVADGRVVQSESFKHTNVIHYDAYHAVEAFNRWSVDEIIVINVSRDIKTQNSFQEIVKHISKTCFVPLTVGGFIDSIEYGSSLIRSGADKILLNTAWYNNIDVINGLYRQYGRQCIVASIDVKSVNGSKQVFIDRGRNNIGAAPVSWAQHCVERGAGEIFFNNIDHDGMRRGYDIESIRTITSKISVPVIAFGGVLQWKHLKEGIEAGADAVAAANVFHYKEMATKQAKRYLLKNNILVRI
jgi:imidazole glycerol-phosphate synthase subunit HisF